MTRDNIQGFIDGYTLAGGQNLKVDLETWMANHPSYPVDQSGVAVITDDLQSYRTTLPPTITATPIKATPPMVDVTP